MATKELKDYLHYYLGCNVQTDLGNGMLEIVSTGDMGCAGDFSIQLEADSEIYHETDLEWIKPILRPLSDMTEDEAIECAKLSEWEPHFRSPKVERTKYNDLVVTWDGANEGGETQNVTGDCFYCAEQFQYLLSKHFDLFELIQYELAIDKTKL